MLTLSHQLRPLQTLIVTFTAWKSLILALALLTNLAEDYDTSTSLLFEQLYGPNISLPLLTTRLTRWDAIYFVRAAREGYVYEQDWAFGAGVSRSIHYVSKAIRATSLPVNDGIEPLVGIALSHVYHLLAVLMLYNLTLLVSKNAKTAFISAFLCIITPGGAFLSSPYGESPFSGLAFTGIYLFAWNYAQASNSLSRSAALVLSGAFIGLATTCRSNGLSYGILFAVEAIRGGLEFLSGPSLDGIVTLAGTILGGILVAAGSIGPQAAAYLRYCTGEAEGSRPWCSHTIPSIYSFVQAEYWDVGFLKYWTPNQIPLFILATPMLTILIISGLAILRNPSKVISTTTKDQRIQFFVQALAGSQAVIAFLAITNYHVQIITRVASGYLVWYWWIASCLTDTKQAKKGQGIVIFMVMYGGIQAILYSLFLPPA